jgi:hypothetical protein
MKWAPYFLDENCLADANPAIDRRMSHSVTRNLLKSQKEVPSSPMTDANAGTIDILGDNQKRHC